MADRCNDDDGWFDWRETFLGGRIQRGEQAPQAPLIWRFIREVFLLLFSFVLSIFPMWHPEPPPLPPPQEDELEDDNDEPLLRNNAQAGGPGVVRPPADPAEAEEDDDWDD